MVSAAPPMMQAEFDWWLLLMPLALASFGFVMISSASMDYAAATFDDQWYYAKRHLLFMGMAALGATAIALIPIAIWDRFGIILLLVGLALLIAVLIPGVGKVVKGSRRWLSAGGFTLQASELAKFCFVVFFASYLARRADELKASWWALIKLLAILGVCLGLLLLEPDFGATVVLCVTTGAMMFAAGVPAGRFFLVAALGVGALTAVAVSADYRWQRLITFLDPWSDRFAHGYQLVQSLIAFGRGEWVGLGLGNSLQKLFFLPEAHTDFIFAIIAEELGLVGALVVIAAFASLVARIFWLARRADVLGQRFIASAAIGMGVMIAAQALINMGVASGFLPTKGLTLPFISAGGSSLLVCGAFTGLLLRMEWELRRGY